MEDGGCGFDRAPRVQGISLFCVSGELLIMLPFFLGCIVFR